MMLKFWNALVIGAGFIGLLTFVLSLTAAHAQDDEPGLPLGFHPDAHALSIDGKSLLLWSKTMSSNEQAREFALVDMESFQVKARKRLRTPLVSAALDSEFVYQRRQDTPGMVYKLDHALDIRDAWRDEGLTSQEYPMVAISPHRLAIFTNPITFLDTSVKPMKRIAETIEPEIQKNAGQNFSLGQHYVELLGRISDTRDDHFVRRSIPSESLFCEGYKSMKPGSPSNIQGWGRRIHEKELSDSEGTKISVLESPYENSICPTWPVLADLVAQETGILNLNLVALVDGHTIQSIRVTEKFEGKPLGLNRTKPAWPHAFFCGQQAIVGCDDMLYRIPLPVAYLASLESPTRFSEDQPWEVQVGGLQEVPLKIVGKKQSFQASLKNNVTGVLMREKDGVLELDTDQIWTNAMGNWLDHSDYIEWDQDQHRSTYRTLTQDELPKDKVAIQLCIRASLEPADGLIHNMQTVLFLIGPKSGLDNKIEKVNSKIMEARAAELDAKIAKNKLAEKAEELSAAHNMEMQKAQFSKLAYAFAKSFGLTTLFVLAYGTVLSLIASRIQWS